MVMKRRFYRNKVKHYIWLLLIPFIIIASGVCFDVKAYDNSFEFDTKVIMSLSEEGSEIQNDITNISYEEEKVVITGYDLIDGLITIDGYTTVDGDNTFFSLKGNLSKSDYFNNRRIIFSLNDEYDNFDCIDSSLYENGNINLFDKSILNNKADYYFTLYLLDNKTRDFIILEIPLIEDVSEYECLFDDFDFYKDADDKDVFWNFKLMKNTGCITQGITQSRGAQDRTIYLIKSFTYFNQSYIDELELYLYFTFNSTIGSGNAGSGVVRMTYVSGQLTNQTTGDTGATMFQLGRAANNVIELHLGDNSDYGFEYSSMTGKTTSLSGISGNSNVSVALSVPINGFVSINVLDFDVMGTDSGEIGINQNDEVYLNNVSKREYTRHIKFSYAKNRILSNSSHYYGGAFTVRDFSESTQNGQIKAVFNIKAYHNAAGDTVSRAQTLSLQFGNT